MVGPCALLQCPCPALTINTKSLPPRYVVSIITYSSTSYCMLCAFSINQQQFFVMARVKPLWVASNDDDDVGIVGAIWVGIWRSEVWLQTQHISPPSCIEEHTIPHHTAPLHSTPLHSTPLHPTPIQSVSTISKIISVPCSV